MKKILKCFFKTAFLCCLILVPITLNGQTPIHYGDCVAGTISSVAQIKTYSFTGNTDDIITVEAARASGNIWPKIEVYSPGVSLLKTITGDPLAQIDTLKLQSNGTYYIWISDGYNGTFTGNFGLSLQCTNNPKKIRTLGYGSSVYDTINYPAFLKTFTFTGNKNDKIAIQASRSSANLWPCITLYDTGGSILKRISGDPKARIDTFCLVESGTYSITLSDGYNGSFTGKFGLSIQSTFNPVNSIPINYGSSINETIEYPAYLDALTFSGVQNDIITIQMGRASGNIWPRIELYDPSGKQIASQTADPTSRINLLKLPTTGKYTIFALDGYNGTFTGGYSINLTGISTSINNKSLNAQRIELNQNYPNPANSYTVIPYYLPKNTHVKISIYDMYGRLMNLIVDEEKQQGLNQTKFKTDNLTKGVYFYRLQTDKFDQTKIMCIEK